MAQTIDITGARVHNLKRVDVRVPSCKMVAVAGVSGSGKSSLALGVLYAEGSRRYLEGSPHTRAAASRKAARRNSTRSSMCRPRSRCISGRACRVYAAPSAR